MMNVMVTGATGLLGQEVVKALRASGMTVHGGSTADFDLRDEHATLHAVLALRPEAIIHCAGYTAVDLAETEVGPCMAVNALGTLHLARAARQVGAKLLYVSTDYVFSGAGDSPWGIDDKPAPCNLYGLSKLQGEEAVRGVLSRYFILRTSWVFGAGGGNFVRTMLRLGQEKPFIRVVNDQVGSPTYAPDLAKLIAQMIVTDRYGVYHATNEGECSFAEYAEAILRAAGSACRVIPVSTAEYGAPARRPLNSRLSKDCLDRAGFARLPGWEDALRRFLNEGMG